MILIFKIEFVIEFESVILVEVGFGFIDMHFCILSFCFYYCFHIIYGSSGWILPNARNQCIF